MTLDGQTTPLEPRPDGMCCGAGLDWQPQAGKPLIHACQLCKASPTYWRRGHPDDQQEARLA